MRSNARYYVSTGLLGFLGLPVPVSILGAIATAIARGGGATAGWAVSSVLTAAIQGPVWFQRGRWGDAPDDWKRALLPVWIPPAYFLLAWAIVFGVTGQSYGESLPVAAYTHFPYLVLVAGILLLGVPEVMPAVLVVSALAGVGGFVLGRRRREEGTTRPRWLAAILVATLVLSGVVTVQVAQAQATADLLRDGTPVPLEMDTYRYRPFEGNDLVVPDRPPSLTISDDYPVLDGATAAYPIYAAMGQAIYAPPAELSEDERHAFVDRYLDCTNTAGGYQRLIDGEADVFFGAQPSQGLKEKAKAAGRTFTLTPIGREAFVFFVNADHPVSGLTTAQIQDIYSGRITNWHELGGPDERIVAFQRPPDSGSQTIMQAKVMKDRQLATPLREQTISGMGGMISSVADYRNTRAAIGYSFRWYATVMNGNPGIKLLAVDGVEPTVDNIRNGAYPFTVDVYAVTAGTTNPHAAGLVDWVVSDEGQALIEKVGYVGLR